MPRCPLCSERSAKRFCPAKSVAICATCCGTKREVEIDCPSSCAYLKAGRDFAGNKPQDHELAAKAREFDARFVQQFGPIIDVLSRGVAQERLAAPWLVDNDAIEVLKSLQKTLKTLDSGIYYESLPEGAGQGSMFRSLKGVVDAMMSPPQDQPYRPLKLSEALRILDFMLLTAATASNGRPKCRQYLDWLSEATQTTMPPPASSRLILP